MTALVTGATGFVGAALVRRLVAAGQEVHILCRRNSELWRLNGIAGELRSHFVDLRDADGVERCVAQIKPEVIYHLATYGGFAGQRDTEAIFGANLSGTMHLLRACEKVGFRCFVNTGSSSEYGMKGAPMREDDLLEPLGDYGVSKAAATLFCRSEALQRALPVVTLRLFSPYGPWDDPKRLIPYLIASLLQGTAPRLSTPDSVRDFVFIDDVLDLFLRVDLLSGLSGEILNVGSGVQTSIGEVAWELGEIIGAAAAPEWGACASPRSEPARWVADVERARTLAGWEPRTGLRAGLEHTVAWMRDHLEHYR